MVETVPVAVGEVDREGVAGISLAPGRMATVFAQAVGTRSATRLVSAARIIPARSAVPAWCASEAGMRLIITAVSPGIDAPVDPRFGRSAHFIVVDPGTMEWQALSNPAMNAHGGAGTRAAQFVTDQKCSAVISGDFGPNAFDALNAAGIAMYLFGSCRTVQEAIQSFKLGQLEQLTSPTGSGKMHG